MLDFMSCQNQAIPMLNEARVMEETRYKRNQKEDLKLGIDYVFELNEKLNTLHPEAKNIIQRMLKIGY